MKEKKWIVDTTLRDGEQQAMIALSPEDKLELGLLLDELGVHEIEAGSPCLGIEEETYLKVLMEKKKKAKVSVWSRARKEDVACAVRCKPDCIHIGTPMSYIQIYTKLKKNKTWIQKNIVECIEVATKSGIEVTVGFEDASRADVGYMVHTAKLIKKMGVKTIRVADTVGVLIPSRAKSIIRQMESQVDIDLEIHAHNDLGMAVANSIEGISSGAKYVDCTLAGIGERSGNCNMYDFIHAAENFFDFGVDKRNVKQVENRLMEILHLE